MAISFDYATKLINVPQVDAQPLMIQTLVNAIREEEASARGITYDQILDASGKETLVSGVTTGITAGLRSTWELEFESGAYQASIDGGNLADALNRVHNTGSPQVLILASAAATAVNTSGSSAPTAAQNATAVWQQVLEGSITAEQLQRIILAALTGETVGISTVQEKYYSADGSKVRIQADFDADNNRITVITDGTS